MDVNMTENYVSTDSSIAASPDAVISELLQENKNLQLRVAVLSARVKQLSEIKEQINNNPRSAIESALHQMSPAAREALMNMEFR